MLLVNARVGQSSIHGLGLIADSFIAKGIAVSKFAPNLDLEISQAQLDSLPEPARQTFRYYSFRHIHSRNYILSFDDDRFTNHSDHPNTNGRKALRDILPGEEITYDYRKWDLDFEWKLAATPSSLAQSLKDEDSEVRLAVLWAMSKVGLQDNTVLPQVGGALRDPNRDIRYYAAKSLAKMGADAGPAAPVLMVALRDEDPKIRYYVAKALARIGPGTSEAVAALSDALQDDESQVRYYSAKALGKIGATAQVALEPLRSALRDRDEKVRHAVTEAIVRIEKPLSHSPQPSIQRRP